MSASTLSDAAIAPRLTRRSLLRLTGRSLIGLCALNSGVLANAAEGELPPHPRLLLNAAGIALLKQRIVDTPWAKESWEHLHAGVDEALNKPVDLPPRGGNWSHNYVCPTHGARLHRGKQIGPWQWEHICPVGPHTLRGDPSQGRLDFDGNVLSEIHFQLADQIVNAGLLTHITGDRRYADRGRAVLLAYADRYLTYPLHDNSGKPGKGGRVASQSLTEASWLIGMAQGADLVWDGMSEDERARAADKLFRPALTEIILPHPLGIHNIQNRHNSAIGLVGFLLGDPDLIARAIEDPKYGYLQQMEKGVLPDGMWLEGSSGYHFFTMEGVWPLTEAARNCGRDLYGPKFRSMFDAPFAFAMPNLVLPDFNDSDAVALQSEADLYEIGYARYNNPLYNALLSRSERHGRIAMLFGASPLPAKGEGATLGSRNSTSSGYAILQRGPGEQATWLCVKYGPHGGGHGHPDKNHFILYSRGQIVAPDGGTHAYGSPLHNGWDKATAAHNTLVVDETSQESARGASLDFGRQQDVDYSVTDAGSIYKGVRFLRTAALLNEDLMVFVDQVTADAPHTLDIVYHQFGTWDALPEGKPWTPPTTPGYKYLTDAHSRPGGEKGLTVATRLQSDWRSAITLAGGEPTDVITGYGIRKTTEDHVPMLIFRRTAQNTAYVWAVSLRGAPVTLEVFPVTDTASGAKMTLDQAVLVRVSGEATGGKTRLLLVNPQKRAVTAPALVNGAGSGPAVFTVI